MGLASDFILIAAAAFLGGFIARSLKLPTILGYIVSGIIFGVFGKTYISSYDTLLDLSQIGIFLLLFTQGFEISIDTIKKVDKKIFIIGVLQVILSSVILLPLFLISGLGVSVSILFAILFSFSSTVVVVKILEEKGKIKAFPGNVILFILLIQDLFIVPVIFLLPLIFEQGGAHSINFFQVLYLIGRFTAIFIVVFLFSKFLLAKVLNFVFRYPSHELTILATIFTTAVSIGLFKLVGLPDSIAAFLAGVIISEQGKNLTPLSEIRPLRDLFLVVFFVLTGMLFSVDYFYNHLYLILALTIGIVFLKYVITFCLLRISFFRVNPSIIISSYLMNVGEFAVVIGQLAFIKHFISADNYYLLLSVFILSLICIPFENKLFQKAYENVSKYSRIKKLFPESGVEHKSVMKEMSHHVIICGHGRVGQEVRNMLILAKIPYIVIDYNKEVVSGLSSLDVNALYGDPTDPHILDMAGITKAKAIVIAVPDTNTSVTILKIIKKINPSISVFGRAHEKNEKEEILSFGAKHVVFPEFDAGIILGEKVLELYQIKDKEKDEYAKRLLEHNEN